MGTIKLTYDSTWDCWVYESTEASSSRTTSISSTTTTTFSSSSNSYSYSSSSGAPLPNSGVLPRSLTLANPNHGSFAKIFKHFWRCIKPRKLDDCSNYSRPPAAKKQKQGGKAGHDGGSTKTRNTTLVQSPLHVPCSPNSAMSPDVRGECLKEAILYCNQSGKSGVGNSTLMS